MFLIIAVCYILPLSRQAEIVVGTIVAVVVVVSCLHLTVELVCVRVKSHCRTRSSTAVLYVNKGNKEREEECALLSSDNEQDTLIFLNDQLIRENGNSNNSTSVVSLDDQTDPSNTIISLDVEIDQSNTVDVTNKRTDQSDEENNSDHNKEPNESSLLLEQSEL